MKLSEEKDIFKAFVKSKNLEESRELFGKLSTIYSQEKRFIDIAHIKLVLATRLLENGYYTKSKEHFFRRYNERKRPSKEKD